MRSYPMPHPEWIRFSAILGFWTLLLFFIAVVLTALYIRQKRCGGLAASLPLLILDYGLIQGLQFLDFSAVHSRWGAAAAYGLASLRVGILLPVFSCLTILEALLLRSVVLYERTHITSMSVKAATDSLPAGICFFTPGGRVLMANRAMESFCRAVTGEMLLDGEQLWARLISGDLLPACESIDAGETPLVVLPDGSAWSVSVHEAPFENTVARMLLAADVTEVFRKTSELRRMQEQVTVLNERLAVYNSEIVALTTAREILNTRVMIHDMLGSSLLAMRRYIAEGGSAEELSGIVNRLRQSISFFRFPQKPSAGRDEYGLILETAEKLGVHVHIAGTLPQTEPYKHVLATAVHECLTNTLRHARGDELSVAVREGDDVITAVFTNNGDQPVGEVREKGGLRSLRAMTENLCHGTMTVASTPLFSITLELPKEGPRAV